MIEIIVIPPASLSTADDAAWVELILDEQERRTYYAYRPEQKRREFLAGRMLIKLTLSNKYSVSPRSIELIKGRYGKPSYPGAWQFNLSHSQGMVACAFARDRAVGLDIESMDPANLQLAGHICTGDELNLIRRNPEREVRTFYELWTRKEAVIKAAGTGFTREPNQIEVPLQPVSCAMNGWTYSEPTEIWPSVLMSCVAEQQDHGEPEISVFTMEWEQLQADLRLAIGN
ncbi:4'-phosphopantetheinyl transferase [Paenibacillus phyllosphaerae]|uniref:4'-phosphopantetheinyl transferase n=1 Tax=Paenibacillus phyllosphaerae TaxID=274593 RepID=A0A7W5AXH6_9BACL|nr:4'-phosphopantetheinyl transferase superfamily protein [Paenibacillus phyllosphaerae]MBB3110071.1 4'-phosphopantetheinyl transferase [Paenibacillus phyllosphaerae]